MSSVEPVAAASPAPAVSSRCHHYRLTAAAEPGMLPRAVELFAKLGLVPGRCLAVVEGAAGEPRLTIEMSVAGLEERMADHIAACMRQIYGVEQVLSWQEPAAMQPAFG
ncbi:MAG TPA: hypothetical protein VFO41_11270 [Alphaproteobacteria bacterium]|nr:hypothetical protein [Alphaproteobacteria bacterium]